MTKNLAVSILIFINSLFCLKYLERVTEFYVLITVLYLVIQVLLVFQGYRFFNLKIVRRIVDGAIIIIPILISIISFLVIHPEDLNVDRWSVIDSFLTELFKGNYPYKATSHVGNYPGPMPFYFIIAIPFFLFKLYSLLSLAGFILLGLFNRIDSKKYQSYLIIAILSVPMLWEVMTLSNIITYSSMVVIGLYYFDKSLLGNGKRLLLLSIVLGFLLSTRSVFSLTYIVFFLSYLTTKTLSFKEFLIYTLLVLTAFSLTFLPLIISFPSQFLEMNPFIIQSSFLLPQKYMPVLFATAFLLGWKARSSQNRFLFSGYVLFFGILFYAVYVVYKHGLSSAFFNSFMDISYFLFCVPFLLLGLNKEFEKSMAIDISK